MVRIACVANSIKWQYQLPSTLATLKAASLFFVTKPGSPICIKSAIIDEVVQYSAMTSSNFTSTHARWYNISMCLARLCLTRSWPTLVCLIAFISQVHGIEIGSKLWNSPLRTAVYKAMLHMNTSTYPKWWVGDNSCAVRCDNYNDVVVVVCCSKFVGAVSIFKTRVREKKERNVY